MKNHSEYIKSVSERTLTAKGQRFVDKCVKILADQKGITRYHSEMRPYTAKLNEIVRHLFIDKMMSKEDIIEIIKNRTIIKGLI